MASEVPAGCESCCRPQLVPGLGERQAVRIADQLKALADPTRLRILRLLAQEEEPVCVCDIVAAFPLGQPTISHHLRILRESGLVDGQKRGLWVHYRVKRDRCAELEDLVRSEVFGEKRPDGKEF